MDYACSFSPEGTSYSQRDGFQGDLQPYCYDEKRDFQRQALLAAHEVSRLYLRGILESYLLLFTNL